jgi:hypothetical protein
MDDGLENAWLNHLAMTTIVLAVLASISSYQWNTHSTRSLLSQSQASDKWSYYQSKSVKGYLFELQKDRLELELAGADSRPPKAGLESYRLRISGYDERVRRYDRERAQVRAEAEALEAACAENQRRAHSFGISAIFFQIGILLCSIAGLLKDKHAWLAGTGLGAAGLFAFVNGFLPWVR